MNRPQLPPIQGRRFDIETLQDTAFSLAAQATKGPTWLRHGGKIAYVVLTEELLDSKHQGNPLYFGLIWPAIVARGWQFVGAMAGDLM